MNTDGNAHKAWEALLNPDVLRPRLLTAAIYIAGFEALKDYVVSNVKQVYWRGFNESGEIIDPKYQTNVLAKNRSPVFASLLWLQENGAIDDGDVENFNRVKACRNALAHKLLSTLGADGLPAEFDQCFAEMIELLRKVGIWWIRNFDMPEELDQDGIEISDAEIIPAPLVTLQVLMDIALGDDARSRYYYDEFRKRFGERLGSSGKNPAEDLGKSKHRS